MSCAAMPPVAALATACAPIPALAPNPWCPAPATGCPALPCPAYHAVPFHVMPCTVLSPCAMPSVLLCHKTCPPICYAPLSCPPLCLPLAMPSTLSCAMAFTLRCCSSSCTNCSLFSPSLSQACIAFHSAPPYATALTLPFYCTTIHPILNLSLFSLLIFVLPNMSCPP